MEVFLAQAVACETCGKKFTPNMIDSFAEHIKGGCPGRQESSGARVTESRAQKPRPRPPVPIEPYISIEGGSPSFPVDFVDGPPPTRPSPDRNDGSEQRFLRDALLRMSREIEGLRRDLESRRGIAREHDVDKARS